MRKTFYFLMIFITSAAGVISQTHELLTHFEKGAHHVTPTYTETVDFCKTLDSVSKVITYSTIGNSARGLDIPLLIADKDGLTDPSLIRAKHRGILLILACNHPGEPDGKDAGLLLFRDIASGDKEILELLDNYSIVFIPVFNVDGHERYGPYTRINQNGPAEAGWRTTAQNLNLNRDFLKAEAPEMKCFLTFYHQWKPDFSIDCHTTNGADYQYVVTYALETGPQTDPGIASWCKEKYLPWIEKKMFDDNYPVFPYIGFRKWHDPREAVMHRPSPAIISNGYFAATNRPGLLIETHMLKPYKVRVEATYAMIRHTLVFLNQQHSELQSIISKADKSMTNGNFTNTGFPVSVGLSNDSVMIGFLGVRFETDSSDLSGGIWFKYFPDEPEIWKRPFYSLPEVKKSITLPKAYVIPPEWSELADRLFLHDVSYTVLEEPKAFQTETIIFENVRFEPQPYEGCMRPMFGVKKSVEMKIFPKGSFIIPVNQKAGRVIALLMEPESQGSFVAWGYFNAIFEQKEYSEMYVMEEIARQMITENPELMSIFENEKAQNSEFYTNPWNVLNWFYQRSPWFDDHLNVYPVGRITESTNY
jgi:hypothetical protein